MQPPYGSLESVRNLTRGSAGALNDPPPCHPRAGGRHLKFARELPRRAVIARASADAAFFYKAAISFLPHMPLFLFDEMADDRLCLFENQEPGQSQRMVLV